MWTLRTALTWKGVSVCVRQTISSFSSNSVAERTLIAVKGDGVQRGLVGEVISRFERRGYKLCGIKMLTPKKSQLDQHYNDLVDRDFYPKVTDQMQLGPMVAMVWEGRNVIQNARTMIGPTQPEECQPGTIRGDFAQFKRRNIVHGSDSVTNAEKEISIWFKHDEIVNWTQDINHLLIEKNK